MADIRINTTILDNFDRGSEVPLSFGGRWGAADSSIWGQMEAKVDGTAGNTVDPNQVDVSAWIQDPVTADCECWGCPVGGAAGAAGAGWRWGIARQLGSGTIDGYQATYFGGIGHAWAIRKYTNASFSEITSTTGPNMVTGAGALVIFQWLGTNLIVAASSDFGANWTNIFSITDSSYSVTDGNNWYMHFGTDDSSNAGTGWDYVGGGMEEDIFIPIIYRRPHE